ncbi:MAG TPA: acyl-CoA synthetase [Acidimicrobiales bacterium]|nr:acyl-CoA synthetase [Acidimicrobiales bacterium]
MEFNLADLFEAAADAFPEREYLVAEGKRRTYAQMEQRANRLAHHLASRGVGPGDHVGIYAYNCVEWVEALWAVFKLRAVWININYRYVADELEYLFDNADLKALVYQLELAPRVLAVRHRLPGLAHSLVVEGPGPAGAEAREAAGRLGSADYEAALAASPPERDFGPRSPDDLYILYTGGTTGMPKGVVWRQEDVFFALGGGIDHVSGERVSRPEQMVEKARAAGSPVTALPIAPLMHGATQWAVMGQSFVGNKIVLMARFDPHRVWRLVEQERVNVVMITGDAMARPLIEALDQPGASYDLSSLVALSSTAAVFSPSVKDQFFARFPNLVVTDAIGSSETGSNGIAMAAPGQSMRGGPTVRPGADVVVLGEDGRPVRPGSGQVGRLARTGNVPLGYYKDEAKTKETFFELDGRRYAMPGDYATVEADGTITLLGRGSVSINSGGEKIFPEEVEAAVKSHPDVYDAVVVGVPDERWGQRVAAVVQPRPGRRPELEAIQAHCRARIAGYKVPRELHLVDQVVRSPSGKPDYRWAYLQATGRPSPI